MGCGGSKKQGGPTVEAARRRLSVGQVDGTSEVKDAGTSDQDRGAVATLNDEDLMALLNTDTTGTGRKFSLGSAEDKGKTSFANKAIEAKGDKQDATGMGYTCRKGLKPESPNQDSWCVMVVEGDFAFYGVFDGHGKQGHDISNFVKENLPKLIIKDARFKEHNEDGKICIDAYKRIQNIIITADQMKKLDAQLAGTTCTTCIHSFVHNKLTFAHVADSTAVLAKLKDKTFTAVQLTRDHKPELKDERARIEKNGGRVVFDGYANHRVYAKNARYPGLNMSRCLGDLLGHQDCGISCEPETMEMQITAEDSFLLLCSDGVWEFITPQEAVDFVKDHGPAKAMVAAEKLAKEAWDRWIKEEGGAVVDDITVVLIHLNMNKRGDS